MKNIPIKNNDIKILGYWDSEPIWRKLTPEEKLLRDTGIDEATAKLAQIVLGNRILSKVK